MLSKSFFLKILLNIALFNLNCHCATEIELQNIEAKTVKIDDVVSKVLDNPTNLPNAARTTTKFATDLATAAAAFGGFLLTNTILPQLSNNSPTMKKAQMPIAIFASLICLRLTRGGIQMVCNFLNWDPRDLAIANALIKNMQNGNMLTSDYLPLQQLIEQAMPQIDSKNRSRSWWKMNKSAKLALSRRIRSCIEAFKHIYKKPMAKNN